MKEMTHFSPEVCEKIEYYVYRLIDPRNGQTFYVGIRSYSGMINLQGALRNTPFIPVRGCMPYCGGRGAAGRLPLRRRKRSAGGCGTPTRSSGSNGCPKSCCGSAHMLFICPGGSRAAGGGCNTCVWHSSSDSRRRRSFAQHGTNNPLRLTDPKASTTIYVSPPAAIMAVLNPFGTFCFAVQPFRLPAACAAGAACKTLIGEKYESLNLLKAQPLCPFGKAEAGIAKPP